ncbi:CDP-glycerol glycerophosphotransferase family protein, partial [Arsukibacterium sp.]|uniref:CDP-glycerol glycerophosphotransferase family protein n=1 Tax=Arsukibacterium sp. TaxID=1977258 RepID=UPI002FDAA45D
INADNSFQPYSLPLSYRLRRATTGLLQLLFQMLRHLIPSSGYLYYAEDFFDSNVLLAYREHRKQHPEEVWLLGRKLKQKIFELDSDNHVLQGLSCHSLWRCLRAKKLVVDHEYTGQVFSLLRRYIPVIQLWHGLPYKALSGNIHYPHICDEAFISSSDWFNQHVFPKIFRAKHYLALGYPRNDAFSQPAEQRDWINAEPLSLLHKVLQDTGDIIVYAPTYRDWGDNDYPLDLEDLNAWCQTQRVSFVLKFHPFISRKFAAAMQLDNLNSLQSLPGLPHIYLYPSGKNVYPWLAEAKVLISDYSSIAYDFMLTGKPIIYYQYDIEKYRELRGETLVADEDFIAGSVAHKQQQLAQLLSDSEASELQLTRKALTEKYMLKSKQATSEIVCYIRR